MIPRDINPQHKTVFLVNDIPVAKEIEREEKFTAASNLNLLSSLRNGKVNHYDKAPSDYKGIFSTDIHTTYLSYNGFFVEKNFDFCHDFRKRKDLIVTDEEFLDKLDGEPFYKLDNQKDVYVSSRLWVEFQHLLAEIRQVEPELIIVTGKWALFFLTGCTSLATNLGKSTDKKPLGGLAKFRSSILRISPCFNITKECILIPIYHTINAISMPDKAFIMEMDIQRVGWVYKNIKELGVGYYIKPEKTYILGISKYIVLLYLNILKQTLNKRPTLVSMDIETKFHSVIDCITVTDSTEIAISIVFCFPGCPNYWDLEEEIEIMVALREVMLHPNCKHVGQNYSYDCQYYYKLWGLHIQPAEDTMVLSHTLFNYLPKNLAFLASLYVDSYCYWKDEI